MEVLSVCKPWLFLYIDYTWLDIWCWSFSCEVLHKVVVVRLWGFFFSILLSWSPFIFKWSAKIWVWKEKSIDPVNVFTLPNLEIFDSANVKDKACVHACGNGRGYTSMLWTKESWASGLRRYTVNDNLKPWASPAVPFVWAVISIQHSDKSSAT